MTDFKDLLKSYRLRAGFKPSALAALVKKSETYIRKLEDGFTPPRFDVCQLMAENLKLSKKEEDIFFKQAFVGRLGDDANYYKRLCSTSNKEMVCDSAVVPNLEIYNHQDYICKCIYFIVWKTRENQTILNSEVRNELTQFLSNHIQGFGLYSQNITITENAVQIILDAEPTTNINDFIQGLKRFSTGHLKSRFKKLSKLTDLWENKYLAFTVGNLPEKHILESYLNERSELEVMKN